MPPKRRKKGKRKSKKKAGAGGRAAAQAMLRPSAELSALLGRRAMTRGDAVKELWAYARAHGLNEGREIRCDAAMQRVFGVPSMTMFQVTGHLSAHLTSTGTSAAAAAAAAAAERPSAARRMATADGERPAKRARTTSSGHRPPESGVVVSALRPPPTGPVLCSALLTAVLCGGGGPTAARDLRQLTLPSVSAVLGRLQCYIAAHKLRVPRSDTITLDGTLRSLGSQRVVGRDRLPLSELYSALIGPHLTPVPATRNVVAGGVESEEEDEEDIVLGDEDDDSEQSDDEESGDGGGDGAAVARRGGAATVETESRAVVATQLGASAGGGGRRASEQRSRRSRVMLSSDEEESDAELRLSVEPPPPQQEVQQRSDRSIPGDTVVPGQEEAPAQAAADGGGGNDAGPQRLGGRDEGQVTQQELRRRRLRALEGEQQPQQQDDKEVEAAGAAAAVDLTEDDHSRVAARLDEWCRQADGIDAESLTGFLNGRTVRVALKGFVAMDLETLAGGLEGMKEAVAAAPNPALSFAVGVVAELIQMRSGGSDGDAPDLEPSDRAGLSVVEPAAAADETPAAAAAAPAAMDGADVPAPSDVGVWLRSVGLGEHSAAFEAERIDMLSLGMLSEADLIDLGLPLGHRRRFQAYMEMFSAEGGAGA